MESRDKERVDQWLDGALKQYGEAEPRVGLEGRVLANLRAARATTPARHNWLPALAMAAAMLVIGAGILLKIERRGGTKEVIVMHAPASTQSLSSVSPDRTFSVVKTSEGTARKKALMKRAPSMETAESGLELAQFPAPRPLTRQEQLLVRYVQERPEEAKRQARAQAELFQQDWAEFAREFGPLEPRQTHDNE